VRQSAVSFEADGLTFEGVVAQPDQGTGPWPGYVESTASSLKGQAGCGSISALPGALARAESKTNNKFY